MPSETTPGHPVPNVFDTEAAASDWTDAEVDDPCIDNYRFAYLDDAPAMARYDDTRHHGCCGSFDSEILVNGRPATIGCNYGH